jgi:hypothetical protein
MAIGASLALRNAQLDVLPAQMGNAAKLRIYDGTRPATGGTATNLLAEFTLGSPPFTGASSGATLTLAAVASVNALANGIATWARVVKSDNTFIMDMSVGVSGADVNLNSVNISQNALVAVTSGTITYGNP